MDSPTTIRGNKNSVRTRRFGRAVAKKPVPRSKGQASRGPELTTPLIKISLKWGWHFRTLLALRDYLRHPIGDRLREPLDAMEPPSLHAVDLLDELYDRELAQALMPIPAEALREIDDAIRRLENGTYGKCQATGRPISKARLRSTPWCRYAAEPAVSATPQRKKTSKHVRSQNPS